MAYEEKWVVCAKRADFKELAKKLNIDQVTARVLVNRDIPEEEMEAFLHPTLDMLHDPRLLKDGDKAASILKEYIDSGKKIRIIGDYDIDGICSTFILHDAMKYLSGNVDYAIPHRISDGYGINGKMVKAAKEEGVELIITCDNGISAFDAMDWAKEEGIPVIITDHHELQFAEDPDDGSFYDRIPECEAAVNPHRRDCPYPFKEICGAEVAFKVVQILFSLYGKDENEAIERYLPFAAFATIGDIMPLKDENRAIVKFGLEALQKTDNPGMKALIERTGLSDAKLSVYHVGFVLGPCFNASGRLDTATLAIELLEEEDESRAVQRAEELVVLNDERKEMTKEGDERALSLIEDKKMEEDPVLVLYVPGLHESLAGLVAGHIKEKYYRPTFVLTDAEDGGLKGSGRSIPGYPMFLRLTEVDELLSKYGGHPMAAGLSLPKENLPEFRKSLIEKCNLSEKELTKKIMIDVPMPISYVSERVVHETEALEPFGQGNENPVFADKDVRIARIAEIGREKQFLRLSLSLPNDLTMSGMCFRNASDIKNAITEKYGEEMYYRLLRGDRTADVRISFTYRPNINVYNGEESLQVLISEFKI
ncbi:MAG: single-stranded-DNA-specific exonuclease RecJ [Lachnospiraceae bacterium]|nr:single-stranded-DNA-specific exonuclease RecJ [Lachnospiraceae bacterium]